MKKVIAYIAIAAVVLLIIYGLINYNRIKPFISNIINAVRIGASIGKAINKETGLKDISVNVELFSKDKHSLIIQIGGDHKGDLEKIAEKVQLIAYDNYPEKLESVEVVFKKKASGITIKVNDKYVTGEPTIISFKKTAEELEKLKNEQLKQQPKQN
jgi:hypothetical protein